MPIFQFFANKATMRKFKDLEQPQIEALLDVLTAAKVIDGELHPDEKAELEEAAKVLPWNSPLTIERYIEEAVHRGYQVEATAENLDAFFKGIGERLGEDWLRQEAYYYASRIALADKQVVEEERMMLKHMVQAFEIPADLQSLIIRKVSAEMDF